MKRTIILMLDSFGVGAAGDAAKFGDLGSDTFGHIAKECAEGRANDGREGPLKLPNLSRLGWHMPPWKALVSLPPGLTPMSS